MSLFIDYDGSYYLYEHFYNVKNRMIRYCYVSFEIKFDKLEDEESHSDWIYWKNHLVNFFMIFDGSEIIRDLRTLGILDPWGL